MFECIILIHVLGKFFVIDFVEYSFGCYTVLAVSDKNDDAC